jgi:hypothetical protein
MYRAQGLRAVAWAQLEQALQYIMGRGLRREFKKLIENINKISI